jgi:hypothetical protein
MRIILTHEQADFDALASLLGAYLVDNTSFPVLPRKMNRNVRAFVTLYGAELPFIEFRDIMMFAWSIRKLWRQSEGLDLIHRCMLLITIRYEAMSRMDGA